MQDSGIFMDQEDPESERSVVNLGKAIDETRVIDYSKEVIEIHENTNKNQMQNPFKNGDLNTGNQSNITQNQDENNKSSNPLIVISKVSEA